MSPNDEVDIELPPKLVDVFTGEARYRGSYGGRGSSKTFNFAKMTAVFAIKYASAGIGGIILCGREFMNSLDDSSLAEVKSAIASEPWLAARFEVGETYIRTIPIFAARVEYKFAGLRHNLDSIKSKSRILILWVDEAEPVTDGAWIKVIPTVRAEGEVDFDTDDNEAFFNWQSEIWVTWNPERKTSATHKRFRLNPPANSKIVEMNWRDNPWFPKVLDVERLDDKEKRPDSYNHIWEGDFVSAQVGAYFASQLTKAREEGRVTNIPIDPNLIVRLFADIGGTGAKSDNFVFWAYQIVGKAIHWVDHYEVQGQPIDAHLAWLRSRGYTPDRAKIWLPHDGATNDKVIDVSYQSALSNAGYDVVVVPNQGKGAAMARVEEMRRLFGSMWFDATRCEPGLDALGWYHAKQDEKREIDLGPDHDWSSHSADAAGLGAIAFEVPRLQRPIVYPKRCIV